MKKRSLILFACLIGISSLASSQPKDTISFWDDKISIGGEVRTRGEWYNNFYTANTPGLANGLSEYDDEFILLRSRAHLDIHPDDWWRVYVEVQDARQFESNYIGRRAVPNNFESDFDLFQGYLDLNKIGGSPFSLRVGRQILLYGNQRLVGPSNWGNTSRTFDAIKLSAAVEDKGVIDFFIAQPVIHDWGTFNTPDDGLPGTGDDNTLYGIYSSWKTIPYMDVFEAYYLMRENDNAGDEVQTLGVRGKGTFAERWDWEAELAGQFGDFRNRDHLAFATHIEAGYTFDMAYKPRLAAEYSYATGDEDPTDADNETFDNLFPTNHMHYGQMDLFSWRNMHDLGVSASAKPLENLLAVLSLHNFFLDEPDSDAWYNAGGGILRNPAAGADSYVGTEIDIKATYNVFKNLDIEGGYSHFFAGSFVDDTGDDDDADWAYVSALLKF